MISLMSVERNANFKPRLFFSFSSSKSSVLWATKETYLDLASVSTEGALKEANQEETYLIEFLWIRMGNHATKE